ncbi:MAG: phosphatase PAP2 family protein [Patescibacteria group bacterium]|nr:phosphatase PAP2 family protein [Patescibacteria group bacterium]
MNLLIIFGAKYLFVLIALIVVIYFLTLSKDKKKEFFLFALIALPAIYIVAKLSSLFFYDPRPFVNEDIIPLIYHAPDNGFPSDHTLISAALAMLVFFYNKKFGLILWVVAILVGISRILSGVHHSIDIIGSILIAIIVSWLIYTYILPKVFKKIFSKEK